MTKKTDLIPEGIPLPNGLKELPKPRKMRHFYQGNPKYAQDRVGHGNSSMHGAGCLVTALDAIAVYLGAVDPQLVDPGEANRLMKLIPGAFDGSNLYMHIGAAALGLQAPAGERIRAAFGSPALKKLLIDTIAAKNCAVLHVSTDGDPKDGGEHFIAAYEISHGQVVCSDPALGGPVFIPLDTMEKKVMWNEKVKLYQICSVAPVRLAD